MNTETRKTLDQIAAWRQAATLAREREAGAKRSIKIWKIISACFAGAAALLGVLSVVMGFDVGRLQIRVEDAEEDLAVLESAIEAHREADKARAEELARAKEALAGRHVADWDVVERLGMAQERLEICEDDFDKAAYRAEIYRHRWRRREADYMACSCELDGRPKWCSVFVAEKVGEVMKIESD